MTAIWLIPIFLGGTALWIAARSWRVARWRRVIGTVRQVVRDETIDAWIVTFAFEEPEGWTSEATLAVETPEQFATGQRVALRRDPMDPTAIETLHPRRIAIVLAMLLAGTALMVAALMPG